MLSKNKQPKNEPNNKVLRHPFSRRSFSKGGCPQIKLPPASARPTEGQRIPLTNVEECDSKALPVPITCRDTAPTDTYSFPPLPPGRKVSLRWLIARAAARQQLVPPTCPAIAPRATAEVLTKADGPPSK
jgi:hypothetical protein